MTQVYEEERGMSPAYIPPQADPRVHEVILNNDLIIDELMRTLRGEIIDSTDNTVKRIGEPIVSERAINWIVSRVLPYTSKIFSLSYLKEDVLGELIYEFEVDVSLELMFPETVGVDRQHRDFVKWLMVHTMLVTAHKARGGETLKKLLAQHQVQETSIVEGQAQRSGGLLGRFKI